MDRAAPHRHAELISAGQLAELIHQQRRRLVALLVRGLGLAHWAQAEDAVQSACVKALETWPQAGVPQQPAAWLYRVAQRQLIDALRGQARLQAWPDEEEFEAPPAANERLQGELIDEELALLFAACHPSLPPATQVLLALRSLAGFELEQLAPLFFSTSAALAQRLARARSLLLAQGVVLAVPAGHELAERCEAVFTALALMFHQGQLAAGRGEVASSGDLAASLQPCWEAIRLARSLSTHAATASPQADALAALLLLHGARLSGRVDAQGDIVPLAGQPRDRWDGGLIRLGMAHLHASQRGGVLTRWHLQAGIAAEHARAPDYAGTDWRAIAGYYALLVALDPSAAPQLGHAIALAEAGQPDDAMKRLQRLLPSLPTSLRAHGLAALSRAAERLGDAAQARVHLSQAVEQATHPADARLLSKRLGSL